MLSMAMTTVGRRVPRARVPRNFERRVEINRVASRRTAGASKRALATSSATGEAPGDKERVCISSTGADSDSTRVDTGDGAGGSGGGIARSWSASSSGGGASAGLASVTSAATTAAVGLGSTRGGTPASREAPRGRERTARRSSARGPRARTSSPPRARCRRPQQQRSSTRTRRAREPRPAPRPPRPNRCPASRRSRRPPCSPSSRRLATTRSRARDRVFKCRCDEARADVFSTNGTLSRETKNSPEGC